MKLNFRKIASVLASTAMLSSTLALAAAANYPAPFVQNGNADVAVVYGSLPGAEFDLASVTTITGNLQAKLSAQSSSSGSSTTTSTSGEGDIVKLDKTSTKFQLGNGVLDVVTGTISDDDLETLLADGVYVDDDNDEFDYTQKIALSNFSVTMFEDNDFESDVPTVAIKIASGAEILNYTLDFSDTPLWSDLETTDLMLLGKNYYVLDTNSPTNTSISLLDSAESTILGEGETKTLTAAGKTYESQISFIGETSVKLLLNGELTNSLSEGQTYKLKDGSYVGVKDILYTSKDSGISKVEFSIGSGKLILTHGQDIEMNDETISRLKSYFTTSSGQLTKIAIDWAADNDVFVANGTEATLPGLGSVKLTYSGMTYPSKEVISVKPASDDYFVLSNFPLKDSTETINILYGSNGLWQGIGKDSDNLLRTSNTTALNFDADTDDYFVISWTDGNDAESYLFRATNFKQENSGAINKTTFQYKKDGSWTNAKEDRQITDTFTMGNAQLTVGAIHYDGKNVTLTAGSGVSFNTLYSDEGLKVFLPFSLNTNGTNYPSTLGGIGFNTANTSQAGHNATSFNLIFVEEDKNENIASGKTFNFTLGWNSATTKQAHVSDVLGESVTFEEHENSDNFISYMYSPLASKLTWDKSGDQYAAEVEYHGDESYANVFLTAESVTVSTTPDGSGTKELGTVHVKDTEVASVSSKNLIVVGGGCVNTLAKELLGGAACGSDFEQKTGVGAGSFLIQSFSRTGGKVATLVAGYSAADTEAGAKVLTTQTVDTSAGKKYKGTGNTVAMVDTTSA